MRNALMHQIESHRPEIEKILNEMNTSHPSKITLAIHEELKTRPSTSLISTSMVRVFRTNRIFHCEIDLSDFGLQSVIIRPSSE
jgi:hypothetical protein